MAEIVFTPEINKRMLQLRVEYDWLFKKRKQPWKEFYKILQEKGFPEEITISQVRKRWSYMYDTYLQYAKNNNKKKWRYYKYFEKIYGPKTNNISPKYVAWSDQWLIKFVTEISEAKRESKKNDLNMWRKVETALRSQDLPIDCCVQDFKGLLHHIRMTFLRKHRLKLKRQGTPMDWPLYEPMIEYCKEFEPEMLTVVHKVERERKSSLNYCKKAAKEEAGDDEFQWSKDITESFIQLRLQNDWLFKERKWAWNDLLEIMINDYGFPKTLTGREIARKWSSTYGDYQKSKATNNKSWVYYPTFELYLGEGNLSLNPAANWKNEWVSCLIDARIENEVVFLRCDYRDQIVGWREVEKRLRTSGLPLDHSLLELPEIWVYLERTYRWKKKFAKKGILNEQWPFFEAMSRYEAIKIKNPVKKQKQEHKLEQYFYEANDSGAVDDDGEDDMKLFDLKVKLEQVKPKIEYIDANQCRSCASEEGCVNIFTHLDQEGVDLAEKLRIAGGIEVTSDDNLPSLICLHCLRELESAYKFRQLCQNVDKTYRSKACNIKTESSNEDNNTMWQDDGNIQDKMNINDSDHNYETDYQEDPQLNELVKKEPPKVSVRRRRKKKKYEYSKMCEVCGKYTTNLKSHVDMHSNDKTYSCDICDKKFKYKSGLFVHRATHDPTPKKTCEVCGKTFHILAQYRRHFVYHANERKFECETCGKKFNTIDILKVHSRIHTDERPFSCSECGKTFRTAGCVSRHKRIVHKTKRSEPQDIVQ